MSDASSKRVRFNKLAEVPWGAIRGIAFILIAVVASGLVAYAFDELYQLVDSRGAPLLLSYLVSSATMLLIALAFLRLRKFPPRQIFGRFRLYQLPLAAIFTVLYLIATVITQQILSLLPSFQVDQKQDLGLGTNVSDRSLWLTFLLICALTPVVEEVMFRGILYRGLSRRRSKLLAAIVASAIFGLAHWQWNVAADVFVLSMLMILAYELSGSLWTTILMHFMKNTLAFVYVYILLK